MAKEEELTQAHHVDEHATNTDGAVPLTDAANGGAGIPDKPTVPTASEREQAPEIEAIGGTGAALAAATLTAYTKDSASFTAWTEQHGLAAFPASRETLIAHLTEILRGGRKPRTAMRIVTSVTYEHRSHGVEPAWGPPKQILEELRTLVPEAFREDPAEIRSAADERSDVLTYLRWLAVQVPSSSRAFELAARLIEQGKHAVAPELDGTDEEDGADLPLRTTCDFCAAVISTGRFATDAEWNAHRCRLEERPSESA
jgi:hypothetical protein